MYQVFFSNKSNNIGVLQRAVKTNCQKLSYKKFEKNHHDP